MSMSYNPYALKHIFIAKSNKSITELPLVLIAIGVAAAVAVVAGAVVFVRTRKK